MRKKCTSVGVSYKDVILFLRIFYVRCSLRKIKLNFLRIFRSEHHGNAEEKAKGTLTLRKLKVDVFTVGYREEVPVSQGCHPSEVPNLYITAKISSS